MTRPSLLPIPLLALVALASCGGGGGGGGGTSSSSAATNRGLVRFEDDGGTDLRWTTGRHLHFKPEIQFASPHTGSFVIPWEVRSGSATGTVLASGSATATDAGDGTHTFFIAPEPDVDLSAVSGGTSVWVILDPAKTLVSPAYTDPAYDSYRVEHDLVPTSG